MSVRHESRVLHAGSVVDLNWHIKIVLSFSTQRSYLDTILSCCCDDLTCIKLKTRDSMVILERVQNPTRSKVPYLNSQSVMVRWWQEMIAYLATHPN